MALGHCTVINSVRPFLFVHKEQLNVICFFPFLNLNTFWVLRFLFLWTFTNLFLRPKKPTTAFLKFSKIWVLFLIYRFLYSDTECTFRNIRNLRTDHKFVLQSRLNLPPQIKVLPVLTQPCFWLLCCLQEQGCVSTGTTLTQMAKNEEMA